MFHGSVMRYANIAYTGKKENLLAHLHILDFPSLVSKYQFLASVSE